MCVCVRVRVCARQRAGACTSQPSFLFYCPCDCSVMCHSSIQTRASQSWWLFLKQDFQPIPLMPPDRELAGGEVCVIFLLYTRRVEWVWMKQCCLSIHPGGVYVTLRLIVLRGSAFHLAWLDWLHWQSFTLAWESWVKLGFCSELPEPFMLWRAVCCKHQHSFCGFY